eukprot:TRINITY_DN11022_c0_g1_i1.p1 TRINITY_DN11022_c0_g1~~TRINITY_DN11022_c0_g1_i1.p1  ORF type:complete len:1017 (+),score=216.96 TRINITY_DN11022_c0_g1_i1:92-3142(+)
MKVESQPFFATHSDFAARASRSCDVFHPYKKSFAHHTHDGTFTSTQINSVRHNKHQTPQQSQIIPTNSRSETATKALHDCSVGNGHEKEKNHPHSHVIHDQISHIPQNRSDLNGTEASLVNRHSRSESELHTTLPKLVLDSCNKRFDEVDLDPTPKYHVEASIAEISIRQSHTPSPSVERNIQNQQQQLSFNTLPSIQVALENQSRSFSMGVSEQTNCSCLCEQSYASVVLERIKAHARDHHVSSGQRDDSIVLEQHAAISNHQNPMQLSSFTSDKILPIGQPSTWGNATLSIETNTSDVDPRLRAKHFVALGNCYAGFGLNRALALAAYEKATKEDATYSLAHYNYAVALQEQQRLSEAASEYEHAIRLEPTMADAYNNLGLVYVQLKRPRDDAILCYRRCLTLQPTHVNAWVNLGDVLKSAHDYRSASIAYQNALLTSPDNITALISMGDFLKETGRPADAIPFFMQVISRNPGNAIGYTSLGHALHHLNRLAEAIAHYQRALQLDPTSLLARNYLANGFKDAGKHKEAVEHYKAVLLMEPFHPAALANMVHSQLFISDWTNRDENMRLLKRIMYEQIQKGEVPYVLPFHAVGYPFDEKEMFVLAKAHGRAVHLSVERFQLKSFPARQIPRENRIRIGYVSSDFANHPLSHLMQSIFGLHDRSRFEVFCYALTPDDGSDWRKKIMIESDSFVDVSSIPFDLAAQKIYQDEIHVLFNLNGYTKGSRNEIFVLRPAPIQALYMGFPGTSGMDSIDYLFADPVAIPTEDQPYYSEKLVQMPHSYFVNDHRNCFRFILDESNLPTRTEVDSLFKDEHFIFCNLNQLYKLDPETFACWCRILKRVPNGVMWLLRFPPEGESSIRQRAIENGLDPSRFIFTNTMQKPEYIRKSTIADLFLDTPECNGHTTGTDALWCGVPFLTLPLRKMASRVGASLLMSLDMPELIVQSYAEYEELAVSIATNPQRHRSLKEKLKVHRLTKPLYDTPLWVREFEAGIEMIVENHRAGNAPRTMIVPNIT